MNFNVSRPSLAFFLGGATFLVTSVATLLDGLCLTSFEHLSSKIRSIESAILALSTGSCVAVIVAILSWMTAAKNDSIRQLSGWRRHVCCLTVVYLAVATGATTAGLAWSTTQALIESKKIPLSSRQRLLMITRTVLWVICVLIQGLLGGLFLTMTLANRTSRSRWPGSLSHDLDTLHEQLVIDCTQESKKPQLAPGPRKHSTDQKRSCDRLATSQPSTSSAASLISKRHSGRTLYRRDSKHGSLELNIPLTYPECAVMRKKLHGSSVGNDSAPGSRKVQRNNSKTRCSFDTVPRKSSLRRSTDTFSSQQPEVLARSARPKLQLSDESNIHPLFRSNNPTPPPTALPGTTVIASPEAGQTISIKALQRMRSINSVRSYTPQSKSPLFERIGQADEEAAHPKQEPGNSKCELRFDHNPAMPSFVMAADLRRSITQYEKRYDLIESPHES
ncbi:hypothetical protein BDV28DRAFT_158525 [Aspergillus coremiiformis]|uniref:Uncharacterized protein n=1 Tax=Aspergillus coremiiformis TaxID=138285 RepID=A0A5N6Z208_9EURO|nr:hypothetical protein BDV28DRAFT_158525 [Aspergillus coremiiformis]